MNPNEQRIRTELDVAGLRADFDRSFAQALDAKTTPAEDFIAVQVGGHPYAIRLSEIMGLYKDRKAVPIVAHTSAFLGVAGFRGALAAVYDLGALLGYARNPTARWLVLARSSSAVELAFDTFEAHVQVTESAQAPSRNDAQNGQFIRGVIHAIDAVRPVIHVASIVEMITLRVQKKIPLGEK